MNFNKCVLYMTPRSPFARRVRVAFLEVGIPFESKEVEVWRPNPELKKLNPLARVPIVQLQTGEVLIESQQILSLFHDSIESSFRYRSNEEVILGSRWTGIALGLMDKLVEFYIESLRPADRRDPEVGEDFEKILGWVLEEAETRISGKSKNEGLVCSGLTQADLDFGVALSYLCFRYSDEWKKRFPTCSQFLERIESRESFQKTRPRK